MTVLYKGGVSSHRLQPIMLLAISRVEKLFNEIKIPLTITSTDDGIHSLGSLHYFGLAIDVRTSDLPRDDVQNVSDSITSVLKSIDQRFQVINEVNHIHIEFDRRIKK